MATSAVSRGTDESRLALCHGNQLIAWGALAAGCDFFSGYPITPASEVYAEMMRRLPDRGGHAVGAPDEISALSYAVGASLTGARAMTATSGPGWCLMTETVQYALMTETPVVIVVSQRLGPATGGATQNAQGDLFLVAYATSGGYPIPVLCPVDGIDAYALTAEAFRIAETLRTPVVLLTDKEVSKTVETVDLAALPTVEVPRRPAAEGDSAYLPYAIDRPEDVPLFAPVGGSRKVTATGSAHDAHGRLKKNDPEVLRQLEHLVAKIDGRANDLENVRLDERPGATTLIVSYGISARSCRKAARDLERDGLATNLMEVLSLYPVPRRAIRQAAAGMRRVVVVEENAPGLYAKEVAPHVGAAELRRVNAVGALIPPEAVMAAVTS